MVCKKEGYKNQNNSSKEWSFHVSLLHRVSFLRRWSSARFFLCQFYTTASSVLFFSKMQSKNWNAYRQGYIIKRIKNALSALLSFNIQSSFTVKNPHVRLVEIGHMTTLCVSVLQSLSAVIKKYNALQLLQLSIHSKTVQTFIQVLVMNSVPLI